MITRHSLPFTLLLILFAVFAWAQTPGSSVQTAKEDGAVRTIFETRAGRINVYLPDDMAAGDAISGTVSIEPAGNTLQERERNSGQLNGYVIALENEKSPVARGVVQHATIASSDRGAKLVLLDPNGKQLGASTIPVSPAASAPTGSTFNLPALGQAGRSLQIQGPFDGDFSNTKASIGGVPANLIAESPRKLVVASPQNVVGATEIKVDEKGVSASGQFRNLKIDLTAPKTSLLRGESTDLHVAVNGLEGIREPVKVEVQNQTPTTVNVSGGNIQNIVIAPSQVQSGGTFPWSTSVTGVSTGSFAIVANVLPVSQPAALPTTGGNRTPSTIPSPTPVLTAMPAPTPSPNQPAVTAATTPTTGATTTAQTSVATAAPKPSPNDLIDGSFTAVATDCCKKFLDQNGVVSFLDNQGNGFRLDKNALTVFIDGKRYEWLFTQDGQPFPVAWMFCHLNDHQIITQLTQVMAQRVAGGNTSESATSVSIGLAGPYRDQKDRPPFYGFLFGAQKAGSDVKEYSVSFSMDAATCKWSWRIFAEGKVREFPLAAVP